MLKIIPFLLAFLLTACASGPGGNTISGPSYSVPFHTPVRVGSVSITQSVTNSIAVADIFTKALYKQKFREIRTKMFNMNYIKRI